MRRFLSAPIALLLFAVASPESAFAGSIVNGGFEVPHLTDGTQYITFGPGSEPTGFGWSVTSGNVNVVVGGGIYITAFAGTQWLDLDGGTAGTIQQSFATTPGTVYSLSFAYANNPVAGTVPATATVSLFNTENNEHLLTPFTISHSTSSGSDPDWIQSPVIQFTAVGALTTLSFASDDPAGSLGGIALDGISVNSVPEPSAVVLMVIGISALFGLRISRIEPGAVSSSAGRSKKS